jgi:hypothetical protein
MSGHMEMQGKSMNRYRRLKRYYTSRKVAGSSLDEAINFSFFT